MSFKVSRIHPMKHLGILLLLGAGLGLATEAAQAANEDAYLGQIQPQSEQHLGQGRSALWTLPDVATQYQPLQLTPAMQAALQAQQEGRFIEALILLEDAGKSPQSGVQASTEAKAELNLLHASFLLQGKQSGQAIKILEPLLANPQHAADAYALTAMARLQQGQMQQALDTARRAQELKDGILAPLAMSYALQGMGHLAEARDVVHGFNAQALNTGTPQQAVALAREAELDLTLDQVQPAVALVNQAEGAEAAHPYVISVGGLAHLIAGQAREAKAAFETALRRDPKDAKALFGLGLAEIKLGNYQAGQKKLQAANEADPGNALILTYLGRAQQQAGQTEAAMASFDSAQQADPKDPTPWLYQAQAELQANRPLDARESLRQAQARSAYRQVYRGEHLLREDQQLLQANLAEIQRRLGMDSLAFHTLADSASEKNAASLRNQADLLQGRRFGESARRSLLLQSLFDDRPGNLPSALDIYGDGAGQTGAAVPQHGAISALSAQEASYNNYDALFGGRTTLEADAVTGSVNTRGEQVRLGVGSDTLGLGIAQRQYKSDGFAQFENLDNRIAQATVQWRPLDSTQLFLSHQAFHSLHGETLYPADPLWNGQYHEIDDNSGITRLGFRQGLSDSGELRGLVSSQQTNQIDNAELIGNTLPYSTMPPFFFGTLPFPQATWYYSSKAQGAELQYRTSGASHAAQWGVSAVRARVDSQWGVTATIAQQLYANWQQALNPYWQLETGLTWGKIYSLSAIAGDSHLLGWMPKLGLVYTPDSETHMRLAAWKSLDNAAVGNASLAPATLAGVVLSRPGDNRKLVRSVTLGADKQLGAAWVAEGQTQRRWEDIPFFDGGGNLGMLSSRVDESRLALHWWPGNQTLNVTLAYDDEFLQNDPGSNPLDSVMRQHLRSQQLGLRWLAGSQWTANVGWSRNQVAATQLSVDINALVPLLLDVQDNFNQTDASLDWQFNRIGSVSMGVRNAAGRSSRYTEIDPLVPRFSKGRMSYVRLKLAW